MLRILELFGGIGACSKAIERLGINYEIVDYVEIDKYAVASFNVIHNTNFEPQDICEWNKDVKVDLIMHGSPCQDFSLAGRQAGGDKDSGTRSSLMYETIRIVDKLRPKYVVWENVKNLISKKHRHNFDAYLEAMKSLGYTNYYQVLNAKDYGIPQNRERIFTISILENKEFEFPPKQELKTKLKDLIETDVDESFYLNEKKVKSIANWKAYQKPFEKIQGNNSICPTLTARGAGEEHSGMITFSDKLEDTTNLQNEILEYGLYDFNSSDRFAKGKRDWGEQEIMNTLKTTHKLGIYNLADLRIRKITPKECWRLMGFDDSDYEKAAMVNSKTQLYKQAGNSIVVNVLEAIFKNLLGEYIC